MRRFTKRLNACNIAIPFSLHEHKKDSLEYENVERFATRVRVR